MIGFLHGHVRAKNINSVLLEVNGIGYVVLVPSRMSEAAILDQELSMYTHLAVREDALTLYGFESEDDKRVFELLIDVSGIGPKLGLAVLSTYTPSEVQTAVSTGNSAAFSAVSGIGKKNADRIVLELKNKVAVAAGVAAATTSSNDLTQALLALGYSAAEAMALGQGIDATLPLEAQIKAALHNK